MVKPATWQKIASCEERHQFYPRAEAMAYLMILSLLMIWPLPGISTVFSAVSASIEDDRNTSTGFSSSPSKRQLQSASQPVSQPISQPVLPLSCWETMVRSYLPAFSSFRTVISSVIRAVNLKTTRAHTHTHTHLISTHVHGICIRTKNSINIQYFL